MPRSRTRTGGDDAPRVASIERVQLLRAGTWAASTGTVRVTTDDLRAMVEAATDGEVDHAPVRIGHIDPRYDGDPALGWVENLRVEGDALYGDLVDVPSRLAEVLPRAFRRRSAEIAWNVRTPSGKRYRAVLAGLALLGVTPPAVKGLDDVLSLYADGATERQTIATGDDGTPAAGALAAEATSALTLYDDHDSPAAAARHNEAVQAVEALAALAGRPAPDELLAQLDQLAGLDQQTDDPEEGGMDPTRLRELLGLPADATDEQVETALNDRSQDDPDTGDGGGGQQEEPAGTPDDESAGDGDGAGEPEGADDRTPELVTLSAGQYQQLQSAAQEGAEARRILREQEAEQVLRTALSEGRIAPADVDDADDGTPGWRTRLRQDLDGTRSLLSRLTPVFPTSEFGSDLSDGRQLSEDAWAEFDRAVWGDAVATTERS